MNFIQNLDMNILEWIQNNMKNPILDKIMPKITSLGNVGMLWIIITIILLLTTRTRKYGFIMVMALLLCFLVGNLGLKPLVARIRPFDVNMTIDILISKPVDFSFPSGHTMTSFASAVVLLYMDKKIGIAASIIAIAITFSRLYLFLHYPTDVLVGMILGILMAIISIMISKYLELKKAKVT